MNVNNPSNSSSSGVSRGRPVRGRTILWGLLVLLALGITIYAVSPYLTLQPAASRIPLNPAVAWHFTILVLHAVTGGGALLLGPWQFVSRLRTRYPAVHRICGRIYMGCVVIGGLAALYSAIVSVDGFVAQLGFLCMALLWLYSIIQAYRAIRHGQIQLHRIWMIRNYALTFAAVTLRIWLGLGIVFLVLTHQMHGKVTASVVYVTAAWISWVSTLVIAEWIITMRLVRSLILKGNREPVKKEGAQPLAAQTA